MIDNFPHEAPLRNRIIKMMAEAEVEKEDAWLVDAALMFSGIDSVTSMLINNVRVRGWEVPHHMEQYAIVLRALYERDSGERVDDWDDHHACMFKLRYGFDLCA